MIRFLKVDAIIQKILLFATCACFLFIIFIGFPLVTLGAWQLISAAIVWSKLKDNSRAKYLVFSICYLGLMWLTVYFIDGILKASDNLYTFVLFLVFILFPIIIAIWYLRLTSQTLKNLKNKRDVEFSDTEMDTILDSDEILRNKI